MPTSAPHDTGYKLLFSHTAMVCDLLIRLTATTLDELFGSTGPLH